MVNCDLNVENVRNIVFTVLFFLGMSPIKKICGKIERGNFNFKKYNEDCYHFCISNRKFKVDKNIKDQFLMLSRNILFLIH